jgi:hypothetical protein
MDASAQDRLRARLAALLRDRGRGYRPSATEPTFFQRFECKYLVHTVHLPQIRNFLRPFVRPDAFAAHWPGYRYAISSLYLDSEDLSLYRQTQAGERDRFKLRVRTYSDAPDDPAYLEVKRKLNAVVHKRRVGLARTEARALLSRSAAASLLCGLDPRCRADADYFLHRVASIAARPVVQVRYLREAYEATGNEPVRVTLDSELQHAVSLETEFGRDDRDWVDTPLAGTIVEVKFTERFPWWLAEFIRRFEMRQRSVPKYIMCLEHALERRHSSTVSRSALGLPVGGLSRRISSFTPWKHQAS